MAFGETYPRRLVMLSSQQSNLPLMSPGITRFLSLHSVLMSLLDCNSEQEYLELIDCLQGRPISVDRRLYTNKYYIGHDDETIRNWATQKPPSYSCRIEQILLIDTNGVL
jgi:hypothetical protein